MKRQTKRQRDESHTRDRKVVHERVNKLKALRQKDGEMKCLALRDDTDARVLRYTPLDIEGFVKSLHSWREDNR